MRPIWSGALTFGLINIPVKLYSASEERALKFKMLTKHGNCPISYLKVVRGTNKEVPYEDIVKGYEYQKGDYVVLTDDDFRKASPRKTKTVDVVSFVDEDEIDSRYVNKPYYLEPDPKAEKAYVLLREALRRAKKVGVATFVLRDKEHVAMIRPEGHALMLVQLRYEDEIRKPEDLKLPKDAKYSEKELKMALALIGQLEEHFNAKEFKDTYTEELEKVIAKKAKGQTVKVSGEDAAPVPTDMKNLMEALRKSLEEEQKRPVRA
ncbi:MAG TPA: Ku protein [Candidatus Paceibacterota bacterium]|jgi:DNA end-binding protein Ku